jgi:hypothetical protein
MTGEKNRPTAGGGARLRPLIEFDTARNPFAGINGHRTGSVHRKRLCGPPGWGLLELVGACWSARLLLPPSARFNSDLTGRHNLRQQAGPLAPGKWYGYCTKPGASGPKPLKDATRSEYES